MSETIKTNQHFYTKDFNGWSNSEDNFVANQELTVTITLKEYRDLIKNAAESRYRLDKETELLSKTEMENSSLRTEVSELKSKIYELQNPEDEVVDID